MSQLTYLVDEICAGAEIYYTGRTGGQYLKTAFILCDDYTELTSKLYLVKVQSTWSDKKASGGGFKNYHDVQQDIKNWFAANRTAEQAQVSTLLDAMAARRKRRNDFFHSTHLLDLSVTHRNCVEAFCDLLEYGELLFGAEWTDQVRAARNLETLQLLLQIERKAFSDPAVSSRVNRLLCDWPRNRSSSAKKGVHLAEYPEDLHLRLCVIHGGRDLRDKLAALLT